MASADAAARAHGRAPPRLWRWLGALVALAIPALAAYTLYYQSRTPMLGFYRESAQERPVVTEVMPGGPAAAAGLRPGDALIAANGVPFVEGYDRQPGKTYTLEVERDGTRLELVVRAATMLWVMRWQVLSAMLVALAFWATGTLLLWRGSGRQDIRLLFLSFQAVGLALLPSLAFPRFQLPPAWMVAVEYAGLFVAAPLFFHYHITFPLALGSCRARRLVLGAIYALALVAAVEALQRPEPWRSPAAYYIVVVVLLALAAAAYVYVRRASPAGRRRLRVVFAGTFLGVAPPLLGFVLPTLTAGYTPDVPRWLVSLFLAIVPASYLYATVHHNLFGIDRLLNRATTLAILSLALFALYGGPVVLLYRYLPGDWLSHAVAVAVVTLLVGLSFDWQRKLVKRGVDTLFYGGWYDYPAVVEKVSDALAHSLDRGQLVEVLGCEVPNLMQLRGARLFIGKESVLPRRTPSDPDAGISFPLRFDGEVRGLWIVGPRRDGDRLSTSDRRILRTVARQAEIALNKVLLIERLHRRVDEIQAAQRQLLRSREEERARLARDLHDGPIQALVGLNLELGLLMGAGALGPQEAGDPQAPDSHVLRTMRDEVQGLLSDLRHVCVELRPPMLDMLGLGAAVRALVEEWSAQHGVAVDLELPPDPTICALSEEVAVNLYKVVQEALSNVARHAAARHVNIRMTCESPKLTLTIRDDGRGFDVPDNLHHLAARGCFGLVGLAERVDLIGGQSTVESAPGQGTTLRLTWPAP